MTPNPLTAYTANEIAARWGIKRPAVHYYLQSVVPACQMEVRGLKANAWRYDQFPAELRAKGDRIAAAKGQRSGEQLLSRPKVEWQPAIPLPELHGDCIDFAVKLQRALAPMLETRNDGNISQQERAAAGIKNYAREFEHAISEKHWWNLYDRTINRDAGAGNWTRLEIYLPNNLKRKESTARRASAAAQFPELQEMIA